MAIAPIAPYSMPTPDDLPANQLPWCPSPARAALLVHDMQSYFLDAFDANRSPMIELLNNVSRLREHCAGLSS